MKQRPRHLPVHIVITVIVALAWAGSLVAASVHAPPSAADPPPAARPEASAPAHPGQTPARAVADKPVDWVALNPEFAGASFVKDRTTCLECHEDSMRTYDHTIHAAALAFAPGTSGAMDCETCHGPRSKHNEDPTDVLAFETLVPADQSKVCLQCHERGTQMSFKSGPHQSADVSCASCHTVMDKKSPKALLSKATPTQLCYSCHSDVRGEMLKASHHPVREGKMECASCHNPHGNTESLLVRNTVNETCATCHADKRGPFLWEHAPVRESCANCHTPHGSNQRFLLTQREPFLCLSCHSYGGHVNLPRYNRTSNPYGSGCTNCHITTHGSNHPSGAKQTR
jgi:DmsE family decaheme c-type cytochrome